MDLVVSRTFITSVIRSTLEIGIHCFETWTDLELGMCLSNVPCSLTLTRGSFSPGSLGLPRRAF